MSAYGITKRSFGAPPWSCELINTVVQAIPNTLGGLLPRTAKYWWLDADSWKYGRWAIAQEMEAHLSPCGTEIVEAIDRLYRQQATIHQGQEWTYTGAGTEADPYVISPDIPVVPPFVEGEQPSVLFYLAKTMRLVDNWVNGTTYVDAPDIRNPRQQLDDILAAIEGGAFDDDEIIAKLVEMIALLA